MKKFKNLVCIVVVALLNGCGGSGSQDALNPSEKSHGQGAKAAQTLTTASYETLVQQLYVAYFGRPADPGGLAAFESALLDAGAPTEISQVYAAYQTTPKVKGLIDSFGTSAESKSLYSGATNNAFVTAIYANVLSRTPEQQGLSFWSGALDAGSLTPGDAALQIMAGALGNTTPQGLLDAQLVNNRVAEASTFTSMLAAQGFTGAYAGAGPAWVARSMLSQVTASTDASSFQTTIQSRVSLISEESNELNALNVFRASQGLTALQQNLPLYQSAAAHAQYMAANNVFSHEETSGMPSFTGIDPGNRAEYFGYPDFNVSEDAEYSGGANGSYAGQGSLSVSHLIATVYHRLDLLYQYENDVGVALALTADGSTSYAAIESGYQNSALTGTSGSGYTNLLPYPTTVTGSYFGVYPTPGQTNVGLHMIPEIPSPFPGFSNGQFSTNTGYPISAAGPTNSITTVTTFTVAAAGSTTPLQTTLFTGSDPNFGGNKNFAFIVGSQPLLPNTTYNVTFAGTSNCVPVAKNWSFTTGNE